MKLCVTVIMMLVFSAASASGHETRPAYLEIKATSAARYRVVWKRPILGEVALRLDLRLPESCHDQEESTRYVTPGALIERRVIACDENGLAGQVVGIDGLEASITDALVRVEYADGETWMQRLTPAAPQATIPARQSAWTVARVYLALGVEHILLGIDHLLFVLALLMLTRGFWLLVKTVTAFTVAHSITLALATLGVVHVPSAPVEAAIALSIVFVAAEIVRLHDGRRGLAARMPWIS